MKLSNYIALLSNPTYREKLAKNNGFIKYVISFSLRNIEIDVPLIYADYYYIEALIRYTKLNQ